MVHRQGQTQPVEVVRLLLNNTIESKLLKIREMAGNEIKNFLNESQICKLFELS